MFGRIAGAMVLIGGGALAVAAVVAAPRILRATRPFARDALRRGLALYDRLRAATAELADDVEDLVAEVRAEAPAAAAGDKDPATAERAV